MKATLRDTARQAGFDDARVAGAVLPGIATARLANWLSNGLHGEMGYMERSGVRRADPSAILPGTRSVIMFTANYHPYQRPTASAVPGFRPDAEPTVRVAKYAVGSDYHYVLRERLAPVLEWLSGQMPGNDWRICIDSAPLLEREFAAAAGIGFFGRNTVLISPGHGSYFFLAAILTTALIEPDTPVDGTCGTCTRCIDACPTNALATPNVLDARRCISYLTIEKRSGLTAEDEPQIGEWAFGCDICQDVCPYNKEPELTPILEFREGTVVKEFEPAQSLLEPGSNRAFERRFARSPLSRPGRKRLQQNARTAARNRLDAVGRRDPGTERHPGS